MSTPQGIRVIPCGTGTVGTEIITTIIDHRPDLQIVGARVYSDAKDGVDVGTLVGRDAIGVTATKSIEKILGLAADRVLYSGSRAHRQGFGIHPVAMRRPRVHLPRRTGAHWTSACGTWRNRDIVKTCGSASFRRPPIPRFPARRLMCRV